MKLTKAFLQKTYLIQEVKGLEHKRLEAIGLITGETIKVIAKAPFSGPYICKVAGVELAIDYVLTKDIELS